LHAEYHQTRVYVERPHQVNDVVATFLRRGIPTNSLAIAELERDVVIASVDDLASTDWLRET